MVTIKFRLLFISVLFGITVLVAGCAGSSQSGTDPLVDPVVESDVDTSSVNQQNSGNTGSNAPEVQEVDNILDEDLVDENDDIEIGELI